MLSCYPDMVAERLVQTGASERYPAGTAAMAGMLMLPTVQDIEMMDPQQLKALLLRQVRGGIYMIENESAEQQVPNQDEASQLPEGASDEQGPQTEPQPQERPRRKKMEKLRERHQYQEQKPQIQSLNLHHRPRER